MNINTTRALLWIVDVALIGAAGLVVVKVDAAKKVGLTETVKFTTDVATELGKTSVAPTKATPRPGAEVFSVVSLSGEVEKPAVEAAPVTASPTPTYEPLDGLIKVVSIQWSSNPEESKVALFPKAAKDQPNEQVIFGSNDLVFFAKGAVVKEIRRREVVFKYGPNESDEQTLKIATEPVRDAAASMPTPTGARVAPSLDGGIIYKPDSGTIQVKAAGRAAIDKDGERILEGVTFGSTDLGGGKKGLKIETVPAGNELAKYGVESGDVLISVNDVPMSTKSEVVDYVKRNSKLSVFDVVFLRRGANLRRKITVEQ